MATAETSRPLPSTGLLRGRRGRRAKEALTAYVFIFPAFLIVGVFGLFPIAFAFYVSLHRWRIKPGDYLGLDNYVKALDTLAYVMAFWMAVIFALLGAIIVIRAWRTARENFDKPWVWLLPGVVTAVGVAALGRFAVLLLPEVLNVSEKAKGQERTQALFLRLLGEAWSTPSVQTALRQALVILVVGFVLAYLIHRFLSRSSYDANYFGSFTASLLLLLAAALLSWLTWTEIQAAYTEALETGESLELWPQIVTISAGFILLIFAWWLWSRAAKSESTAGLLLRLWAAAAITVAAWALIAELPRVIAAGDKDWWQGLKVTIFYSAGTVPFQLGISLVLATLLFQNIRGKSAFRLIFFLPYITPVVAAAAVFRILFSGNATGPINSLLAQLGLSPLLWLNEPQGVFQMIAGDAVDLPRMLAGPSLALVVIIIFNVWSYIGYDTVIFLAGLGGIPGELYEAAAIDGAGRWHQFRYITLPMLSPTIYFLTLLAVIGTFKAFNHVWVLRNAAALGTTDTASIVIFSEFNRTTRYGYAASLALVLLTVILILTIINNRLAEERVFYG